MKRKDVLKIYYQKKKKDLYIHVKDSMSYSGKIASLIDTGDENMKIIVVTQTDWQTILIADIEDIEIIEE